MKPYISIQYMVIVSYLGFHYPRAVLHLRTQYCRLDSVVVLIFLQKEGIAI